MNLEDLAIILTKIGIPDSYVQPRKPNELLVPCPLARWTHKKGTDSNPSMSIRYDDPTKPTLFRCFSCQERGKLWYLVHSIGQFQKDPELEMMGMRLAVSDEPTLLSRLDHVVKDFDQWVFKPEDNKLRVLQEHILDHFPKAWHVERARTYLTKRGFGAREAEFWDLRWHDKSNRIMFPVRMRNGDLVGAVGRAIFDATQPKYYNFFGFETGLTVGGAHKFTGKKKLGVVEGFFDVINAYWYAQDTGYDLGCTFTSRTSEAQAKLLTNEDASLHYFYDLDPSGDRGWVEAQKLLGLSTFGLKRITWANPNLDVGQFDEIQWNYAIGLNQ